MFKVYVATNLLNNKIYVGQTFQALKDRWRDHFKHARAGRKTHMSNALRKYGRDSFHLQEVGVTPDKACANNLEKLWIILLRSANSEYGYNSTLGGDGLFPTENTRLRMSVSHQGKKHNPEVRAKMSAAHLKRYASPEAHLKSSEAVKHWWKLRKKEI